VAYYVKVVEDTPAHSASEMYPKESSFLRYITYNDICGESPLAKALKWSSTLSLAKIWHIISH